MVVFYAATWATLKIKLEKIKKISPEKKIHIPGNMTYLTSKPSENFLKLSSLKKLNKTFYTLNKTPLGETGCLRNLYYLLAAQASKIDF